MNENSNIEKILNKLRKLTALQQSARELGNEGEANAAAAGISRLLTEYNLSLNDIPENEKPSDPVDIEDIPVYKPYSQYKWQTNLIVTLSHFNYTYSLQSLHYNEKKHKGEKIFQIVGRKKNREVVSYLYSFLCHKFVTIGRQKYEGYKLNYIKSTGLTPPTLTVYMKSFLQGCVSGLWKKLEEERSSFGKNIIALVQSTESEINKYMENLNLKKAPKRRKSTYDAEIYDEGYNTGSTIHLEKGIGQNTTSRKSIT